jgi:hypothetical protein
VLQNKQEDPCNANAAGRRETGVGTGRQVRDGAGGTTRGGIDFYGKQISTERHGSQRQRDRETVS